MEMNCKADLAAPLLASPDRPKNATRPWWLGSFARLTFSDLSPSLFANGLTLGEAMRQPGGLDEAAARLQRRMRDMPEETVARALAATFWRDMLKAAACKLCADVLRYVPPLLLSRLLVGLAHHSSSDPLSLYVLAVLLPLVSLAQALVVNQYFWHALRTGVLVRGALTAAVCERTLRYRRRDGTDGGKLSNLIASDVGRLNTLCGCLNMAWSAPLQVALALFLLWRSLGASVLGGVAMMLALWPAQMCLSRALATQRARTARATDTRLARTEAAMAASRAVKLEACEALCEAEVRAARVAERLALRREALLKALNIVLATLAPTLVSLCTFAVLTLSGQPLHASTVCCAQAAASSKACTAPECLSNDEAP